MGVIHHSGVGRFTLILRLVAAHLPFHNDFVLADGRRLIQLLSRILASGGLVGGRLFVNILLAEPLLPRPRVLRFNTVYHLGMDPRHPEPIVIAERVHVGGAAVS